MGERKTSVAASYNYLYNSSGVGPMLPGTATYTNIANIDLSIGHRGWQYLGNRLDDVGGPFLLSTVKYNITTGMCNHGMYRGPYTVANSSGPSMFGHFGWQSQSILRSAGATAMSRVIPTNPAMSLSTTLGEITREGLPKMIGSTAFKNQVRTAKKAGDEYLNVEFGWLPIVRDIRKFCHIVKHRHELMENYIEGSNRKIKRRYTYPQNSSDNLHRSHTGIGYVNAVTALSGETHVTDLSERNNHFAGAFRYYVPTSVTHKEKAAYWYAQANKLLGIELTPEVVWNLSPWSWALDWFSNTGDVIKNISRLGTDGLVLQYGYSMYESKTSRTVSFNSSNPAISGGSSFRIEYANKMRIPANPYGFSGLTFEGLSTRQKAIIAALGLSRAF